MSKYDLPRTEEVDLLDGFVTNKKPEPFYYHYLGLINYIIQRAFVRYKFYSKNFMIEEVQQEVFFNLLKYDYDPSRGSLKNWIILISYRTAYRFLKKEGKYTIEYTDDNDSYDIVSNIINKIELDIVSHIHAVELLSIINENLSKLSDIEHLVIKLFYYDGLDSYQTAKCLGKTANSIFVILHRSRSKLKELIKKNHPELFLDTL